MVIKTHFLKGLGDIVFSKYIFVYLLQLNIAEGFVNVLIIDTRIPINEVNKMKNFK